MKKTKKKLHWAWLVVLLLPVLIWAIVISIPKWIIYNAENWQPRSFSASPLPSVFLEDLTWVEIRSVIRKGKTNVIVPTGGTEQNGPHMVLGKHNYIVRYTCEQIARELGNTLVAPVMAYVPEGSIENKSGHMHFAGTLTLPVETFEQVLESTARSLAAHGFKNVFFVGDSSFNQEPQENVARKLSEEWRDKGLRVFSVSDYYASEQNGQVEWLKSIGKTEEVIGTHAGIRDTSELLAVHPEGVRRQYLQPNGGSHSFITGVIGNPTEASPEIGQKMLNLKIQAALAQMRGQLERK